jgi:hypothetical protein
MAPSSSLSLSPKMQGPPTPWWSGVVDFAKNTTEQDKVDQQQRQEDEQQGLKEELYLHQLDSYKIVGGRVCTRPIEEELEEAYLLELQQLQGRTASWVAGRRIIYFFAYILNSYFFLILGEGEFDSPAPSNDCILQGQLLVTKLHQQMDGEKGEACSCDSTLGLNPLWPNPTIKNQEGEEEEEDASDAEDANLSAAKHLIYHQEEDEHEYDVQV